METVKVTELQMPTIAATSGSLNGYTEAVFGRPAKNYFLPGSVNEYEAYAYFNYPASTFKNDFKDCVSIDSVKFIVGYCKSYYDELTWQFSVDGYDYTGGGTWDSTALRQTGMQYSSSAVYEASGKFEKRDTLGTAFEHTAENVPTVAELTTNGVQCQWRIKLAWSAKNPAYYDIYAGHGNITVVGTKADGTTVTKTYSRAGRDKGGVLFNGTTSLFLENGTLAYSMTPAQLFNTACWNSTTVKSVKVRILGVTSSDVNAVWTIEGGLTAGTNGYTKDDTGVYEIPKTQIYSGTLTADNTEIAFTIENPGDLWTNGAYTAFKVSCSNCAKFTELSFYNVVLDMEYEIDEKELGTVRTQTEIRTTAGGMFTTIPKKKPEGYIGIKSIKLKGKIRKKTPGVMNWKINEVRYNYFNGIGLSQYGYVREVPENLSGSVEYPQWQDFEYKIFKGQLQKIAERCVERKWGLGYNINFAADDDVYGKFWLEIEWAMPDYTVTLTAGENGTVEGSGTYHFGEPATIKAIGNENFTLKNWSDGNEGAVRQVISEEVVMSDSSDTAPSNEIVLSAEFENEVPTPVHSVHKVTWGGKAFKALLKLTDIMPEAWDALTSDTVDGLKTRTWASLIEE